MELKLGVFLIIVGGIVFLGFLLSPLWLPPDGYIHTGKGLFSQGDYLGFKEAMASKDVDVISVDILNDDFPILVNYSFKSPSDTPLFDEDIEENHEYRYMFIAFLSLAFFIPGMELHYKGDQK